jgi:hypothetical protein
MDERRRAGLQDCPVGNTEFAEDILMNMKTQDYC